MKNHKKKAECIAFVNHKGGTGKTTSCLSIAGYLAKNGSKVVGEGGDLSERASLGGMTGSWAASVDSMNTLINSLAQPTAEVKRVVTAVAKGDLSQKVALEVQGVSLKGEFLQIATTANTMVDQLNVFAGEVGTEGKLGGRAEVKGVSGTWKELEDNVNTMVANLTSQVRDIAQVTTAVAQGDLSKKITVEAKGEILELKKTINGMVDNLGDVLGDVNSVMSMVAEGNLTRRVSSEASGEFASMVKGINGTIESLRRIIMELAEVGTNVVAVSQNISSAGQEINAMATQVSSSVEQIAEGAKAQAEQIIGASKGSEGVGASASDTLKKAELMNELSQLANKSSQDGSKLMEETIQSTQLMLEGSKESVTRIETLSKTANRFKRSSS